MPGAKTDGCSQVIAPQQNTLNHQQIFSHQTHIDGLVKHVTIHERTS